MSQNTVVIGTSQRGINEKIREVLSDKAYVKELLQLDNAEEVQVSLRIKGVVLSIDEIMQCRNMMERAENEELTDDELESVAGGCWVWCVIGGLGTLALGVYTGCKLRW